MTRLAAAAVAIAVSALSVRASADDAKTADEKFASAQLLREAGQITEACALFAASLVLNPNAIGTILNVARCAEEDGKIATAVRYFTDARDRALEQNLDPQRKAAEEHLVKLTGLAPHLAIAFEERPIADTKVVIDDRVVDPSSYADVLVDAGTVRVVVSAPGRVQYNTAISIMNGERKAVAVPKLVLPVTVRSTGRAIGKVMVFVGAGTIVASEALALYARAKWHNAIDQCIAGGPNGHLCTTAEYADAKQALGYGDAATGIGIAGLVLTGAGATLWLIAKQLEVVPAAARVTIAPVVGADQAGVAAFGSF